MAGILDEFLLLFRPTVKGAGFQVLNKQMKSTYDGLFSLKNLFSTFIGYDVYSGLKQFGMSLVNATREMGAMKSRFYAITASQEKANEQLQWAFKLAERTAMPMKSIADSYSIFYAATAKGLGDSGAQQVFQDWTEVSRVLHMSEYQFERVTYALREMASKGVVYSQDLRMQIGTHVPNAIGLAQKAVNDLGITGTDWFEKFQKQSKGNQKMINQFLLLFSKYAKEQFADPKALAEAMKQPDAQILRLQNQWDKLRYSIAESGFGDDLAKNLTHLNDTLDKLLSHSKELYKILKDISKIILIIFGWKLFRQGVKGLRFATVMFKRTLGKGKGLKILAKLISGQLFKRFFSMGLKGVLAFIPYIGQILFILWTIWDVGLLLWDLLRVKFPNQIAKLTTSISLWWDNLIAEFKPTFDDIIVILKAIGTIIYYVIIVPLKFLLKLLWGIIKILGGILIGTLKIIGTVIYWVIIKPIQLALHLIAEIIRGIGRIKDKWSGIKDNNNKFPGVTPDKNSWDEIYKNQLINNPLSKYPQNYANSQIPPINITNSNNINANGLSASELEDVLNRTNKTNTDRTIQGIRDSFNKPSR